MSLLVKLHLLGTSSSIFQAFQTTMAVELQLYSKKSLDFGFFQQFRLLLHLSMPALQIQIVVCTFSQSTDHHHLLKNGLKTSDFLVEFDNLLNL